jgi:multicomponent Na+:H+ antiporter subunit D
MAILAALCLAQGLYPKMLYQFLPHQQVVGEFHPWAAWNVVQALALLGFSGLAFYVMRKVIEPHKALNLDFDWLYRLVAKATVFLVCRPIAFIDGLWSEAWNAVALRVLKGLAFLAAWFDRRAIDGVVDGSAYGVGALGRTAALIQNGRLQVYLGLMVVIALAVFAFFWYGL